MSRERIVHGRRRERRADPASDAPRSRKVRVVTRLLAFTLLSVLAVWLASLWRLDTAVELELTTRRLALTLAGDERQEILSGAPFTSLTVERPRSLTLYPEQLRVADPATGAWHEVETKGAAVRFPGTDPDAKATLRGLGAPARLTLPTLAAGRQVILEIAPGPSLTVEIDGSTSFGVAMPGEFELVTEFLTATVLPPANLAVPVAGDLLTWRVATPDSRRLVEIESRDSGIVLVLALPEGVPRQLFPEQPRWPLAAVQFLAESLKGDLQSPLVDSGVLRYPGTTAPEREIAAREFVRFESLAATRLTRLGLNEGKDALDVRISGVFSQAEGTKGAFPVDYRLSVVDRLRHGPSWRLLAAVALWVLSATWTGYLAFKKLDE